MAGADLGRFHKGEEDRLHKIIRQKLSPVRRRPALRDTSSPTRHKVKPLKVDETLKAVTNQSGYASYCSTMSQIVQLNHNLY
jgi:hypothetical protein